MDTLKDAETFEVYAGTEKGDGEPLMVLGDRRDAENAADAMAMGGRPASVYVVHGGSSERVYAVCM